MMIEEWFIIHAWSVAFFKTSQGALVRCYCWW